MGQRTTRSKKLIVQKETLRKLAQRTLSDEQLRVAAGGMEGGRCTIHGCAPSQNGC